MSDIIKLVLLIVLTIAATPIVLVILVAVGGAIIAAYIHIIEAIENAKGRRIK